MVTGFVATMMLLVEYLNVLSRGQWQSHLARSFWGQYLLAGFLGVIPGCLGAFSVVAMYSHGALTLGAVVAAMIAASGDEAFVMLALIPRQALVLMAILLAAGVAAGALTDLLLGKRREALAASCERLGVHPQEQCRCFPRGHILAQWKECTPARGVLSAALSLLVAGLLAGRLGPVEWNWIRITLLVVSSSTLFVVATVPDHFLEEHLWQHVARKHAPRVFLWTLGALIAADALGDLMRLNPEVTRTKWLLLLVAGLIGLIPESGPHLILVTLFAKGIVPFSVLLANSVVQDGHGMLPLLAHSRREFVLVKAIDLAVGMVLGGVALSLGF